VLQAIFQAGDLKPGEVVIEIGPGLGVLTEELLAAGCIVHAFELDPVMVKVLKEDFSNYIQEGSLIIHEGDAILLLPSVVANFTAPYKVVANLPYQITTPLFQVLLQDSEVGKRPMQFSLLVQREVAERLCAKPKTGERSYLSVLVQYFTSLKLIKVVKPESFMPAPKVDSAVLQLVSRDSFPIATAEEKLFLQFVKRGFTERRKQLKNVLAGIKGVSHQEIADWLVSHDFPATVRAQELSENDWLKLYHGN
jgi:16S rRNA (adenine1518-N6/adenine1519-N6)-dimethyltransferase